MASVSEAQRDFNLLRHIARYCDDAIDAARQAGSEAVFCGESAVSACGSHVCAGNWGIVQALV